VELPEKQGLKPWNTWGGYLKRKVAVELPEKQGLKHFYVVVINSAQFVAVELPEKQGLKLTDSPLLYQWPSSCSGTSRKTRIET